MAPLAMLIIHLNLACACELLKLPKLTLTGSLETNSRKNNYSDKVKELHIYCHEVSRQQEYLLEALQ